MPPINQGSKGALITWTVVATVFGILMAVLALVFYADKSRAETLLGSEREQINDVATPADINSGAVTALRTQRDTAQATAVKLLPFAINQSVTMAEAVAGQSDPEAAMTVVGATVADVNAELPAGRQATSLADAANQALAVLNSTRQEMETLRQSYARLESDLQNQAATFEEQALALTTASQTAQEERQAALAAAESATAGMGDLTAATVEALDVLGGDFDVTRGELDSQIQTANAEIRRLRQSLERATAALQVQIGGEQLVTQPDGQIIRSPSENRLTIDLGRRHSIARGMTFEVYDSVRGVPAVTGDPDAGTAELPRGKASIEIIRVSETSSEARIIAQQPGTTVSEGDIIANLAYDRNIPIRFRIYGDFDLEGDGSPNVEDRQRLESLVSEFGGEVVQSVNVDTDVVVLGKQPEIPEFTDEDLLNPIKQQALFRARTALEQYTAVVEQARQLNKTIVNQNQLLYYIGYFSQAQR